MEEHKLARALTAAGMGGAALAAGSLLLSGLYVALPDGAPAAAQSAPCSTPACSLPPAVSPSSNADHITPLAAPPTSVATQPAGPKAPAIVPAAPSPQLTKQSPTVWSNPVPTVHADAPVVAMDSAGGSLVMVGSDGGVFPIGQAGFYGSLGGKGVQSRITSAAVDPSTGGYWLAGSDGSVFALNADFHGSLGKHHPVAPVASMASTPHGDGYWLVTSTGGVFSFGAATFHGSIGPGLRSEIVDIVATPDGNGYWLLSAAGGIYAFGDAGYFGSLGGHAPASPLVAMATTPSGKGYWLLTAGGGVFNFGDATFAGSANTLGHQAPLAAIVVTPSGSGYWIADQAGEVFSFGDAVQVQTSPPPQVRGLAAAAPGATGAAAAAPAEAIAAPSKPVVAAADVATDLEHYRAGVAGLDISQYQCKNIPAGPTAIAVVQVTGGGLGEPPNKCYAQEAAWAGKNLSVYIYMDGLSNGPIPSSALNGPHGHCKPGMFACMSYNYGYNMANYYVRYSRSLGINPKLWWLDVERYSYWGATGSNALIIRGALDALHADHLKSGVYSTATQWNQITGGMSIPGEAEWVPGAGMRAGAGYTATSFCATPGTYSFGGGRLDLIQFGYSGPFPGSYAGPTTYDQDYACK